MWLKIFPITVFFHFFIEVQKLSKIDILQNLLCPATECVLFSPTYVIIPLNLASSYQKSLVRTGLRAYQSPVGESGLYEVEKLKYFDSGLAHKVKQSASMFLGSGDIIGGPFLRYLINIPTNTAELPTSFFSILKTTPYFATTLTTSSS